MRRLLLLSAFATAVAFAQSPADPPERVALLRKAHLVRPNATDFVWRQIPWHTDPDAALKEAKAEKRPLFVWLADGRDHDGSPLERCCAYAASLREGPLNDVAVVRAVSAKFVPVALNVDRLPKGTAAGKFFRDLTTEWPQGLWVVAPDGKVLAFHFHQTDPKWTADQNRKRWVDDTRAMLEKAAKEAGELSHRAAKMRNPFPDRGVGLTDGGARLAVSVIAIHGGRQSGASAVDSITFSKDEWATFAPPVGKTEWEVPPDVARKFRAALAPHADPAFVPAIKDVTEAKLTAKVVRTDGGRTVIQFAGEWASKHFRDGDPKHLLAATATGDGVAVYDAAKKELVNVLFVLHGKFAGTPTAAVAEWQRD